jgi:nicotinate-nucleotide adenylyltransferase
VTGILGGTFDPPHNGHVALARAAFDRFGLERLVVMVAGRPPHKHATLDGETRFRLAEAAFAALPRTELSRFELERDVPAFTLETVRYGKDRWGEIVFLVGADEFADFPSWHEPDAVLEHARLGVATRPGIERERLERVLRVLARPDRVEFFEIPPLPVSSSDVRRRVAYGESIKDLVPAEVARLVSELDLYRR